MKRQVFGTFLMGATVTWLLSYAVHLAGFTNLAYVVAAFFGAVTGVATVVDYIDERARRDYDREIEVTGNSKVAFVGGEDSIPPEIRKIIESFIAAHGDAVTGAVVKVTKVPHQRGPEPVLTDEELDEIEEKFS